MQEIKCPKCGEVFQVDESGYAAIVKQVRDKEFEKEIKQREDALLSEKNSAVAVAVTKAEADKDKIIADLRARLNADSLEKHQVYVSAKTSCCPANMPSKLVFALTHNKALALNSVRVSISHLNSVDDIAVFKQAFDLAYKETFHE